MSELLLHQMLHGYRRGHELLASSIRLPANALELVTRLSDLSGSIVSGWEFPSYTTGYPIVGSPYFAIARTWKDEEASRSGCVLTHTLLVPIEAWRTAPDPRAFEALFANQKELRNDDLFKRPLPFDRPLPKSLHPLSLPKEAMVDFVRKYYGEGQRPLIWVDCPDPESTAWSIVRILWPALREKFAWCTASLQLRSVEAKPLDLQFVPAAAYSRFHNIERENFVDGSMVGAPIEPWCVPCADWILSGSQVGPVAEEVSAFAPYLRDDPTLMRHLFLAQDLAGRTESSSAAGAGLLDVVETLTPDPSEAVEYKFRIARKAIGAAVSSSPDEALKCLYLISERLSGEAFGQIAKELGEQLRRLVGKLAVDHPRESLVMPERHVPRTDMASTPYFIGVVDGLTTCAIASPKTLLCLQEFNRIPPHLIAASPSIAGGFVKGVHLSGNSGQALDTMARWLAGLADPHTRRSLRNVVLPEIRHEQDVVVLEQLCQDLPAGEVGETLSALARADNAFQSSKLATVVQEMVAMPHPEQVRAWANEQKKWSTGVSSLISATFARDSTGLNQVLEFALGSGERRTDLLTVFLDDCTSVRVPGWLKDATSLSSEWLSQLIMLGDTMSSRTAAVLGRILPELKSAPLATGSHLQCFFSALSKLTFWPALVSLTLQDAVVGFIEGRVREVDCRSWFSEAWAADWVNSLTRGELASLVVHPVSDLPRRERAFAWLAFAPEALYLRGDNLMNDLFSELVSGRRYGWTQAMGIAWAEGIRRVRVSDPVGSLRMCAESLQFGLHHTGEPIGAAVATAFHPVYQAVCDSDQTPREVATLFRWFHWDRAKELRKGLVEAFVSSSWNPGDLALAANQDEQLLRKLIKRTLRTQNGYSYVTAILSDLVSRRDPLITRTVELVRELAENPNFYEPWD